MVSLTRSVLGWKFREQVKANSHMLLGNIMHQLFQESITTKKIAKSDLTRTLNDLIKRKFYVNQIYEMGCSEAEILKEALLYLDNIESWLRKHIPSQPNRLNAAQPTSSNISQDNFTITDICDIEESIWLPKYGMEFVEEYSFENFKFRLLTKIA
jgi:hypothetical protein